jgi:spore maturation protein CgeB
MMRSLRILVPNFPAPDSFTDNVVHTLRGMGHEVRCMDRPVSRDRGRIRRIVHDARAGYFPDTLSGQERWALLQAKEWKPDLVLCLTLALREEVLWELKRRGVGVCAAWWGDTPANMRGMGLLQDGWDQIYLKDVDAVTKFHAVGLPAAVLHEAANPEWHHPVPSRSQEDSDVVIVAGNYYGYRQFLVGRLADAGIPLALYGTKPPRWSTGAVRAHFRNRYIVREEKSRIFHAGLACLNSTHLSEGQSLNCRAFEICATGSLQLIEPKRALSDCFEPGREVLTYSSVDEIVAHLERARTEPEWARGIREAGLRRTLAEHTYRHRLTHILNDTGLMPRTNA